MYVKAPGSFSTGRSKAVPLLQSFLICSSMVSYLPFALLLFVSHFSFWGLMGYVNRDLIFLLLV